MIEQQALTTMFLVTAQGTMALIFLLTAARSASALDAVRNLQKLARQAGHLAEDRIAPEALDPRLQRPYFTLTEGYTSQEQMREIEFWAGEGLEQMVSQHQHRLSSLRRTGPQLGLFFTVLAIVIGLSGGDNGSSALTATLGPALTTTAVAAFCNAILGAVQSKVEWALDNTEHAIVVALRKVRVEAQSLSSEEAF